jgi:fucose 4-O-acetylase-like acetyltransferase
MESIHLAQDGEQRRALVNTGMDLRIPYKIWELLEWLYDCWLLKKDSGRWSWLWCSSLPQGRVAGNAQRNFSLSLLPAGRISPTVWFPHSCSLDNQAILCVCVVYSTTLSVTRTIYSVEWLKVVNASPRWCLYFEVVVGLAGSNDP